MAEARLDGTSPNDAGGVASPNGVVGVTSPDSSTGGRQRCQRLKSLREEYHVVSAIDGFLALGLVCHHGDELCTVFVTVWSNIDFTGTILCCHSVSMVKGYCPTHALDKVM